jgi:nitrate/nitrite transporter NarK
LTRIPLSISSTRYGVIAPLLASQTFALLGLFVLFFVILFATAGPDLFGVYCMLALVIGVAGSAFPLCFLQVSFWTPKAKQGLAIAAYTGSIKGKNAFVFFTK